MKLIDKLRKYKILVDSTLLKPVREFYIKSKWYMLFPNSRVSFDILPQKMVDIKVGAYSESYTIQIWGGQEKDGHYQICIGERTFIGPEVVFVLSNGHKIGDASKSDKVKTGYVKIGNDVFIGGRVVIMKNVLIGDNATVGTGSVVTHDVADGDIVAGATAKSIRNKIKVNKVSNVTKPPSTSHSKGQGFSGAIQ